MSILWSSLGSTTTLWSGLVLRTAFWIWITSLITAQFGRGFFLVTVIRRHFTIPQTLAFTSYLIPLPHKCAYACASTVMLLAHYYVVCSYFGFLYPIRQWTSWWYESWMNVWIFNFTKTKLALSRVSSSTSTKEYVVTCRGRTNKATYTELISTLEGAEPYFTLGTGSHRLVNQNRIPEWSVTLKTTELS